MMTYTAEQFKNKREAFTKCAVTSFKGYTRNDAIAWVRRRGDIVGEIVGGPLTIIYLPK